MDQVQKAASLAQRYGDDLSIKDKTQEDRKGRCSRRLLLQRVLNENEFNAWEFLAVNRGGGCSNAENNMTNNRGPFEALQQANAHVVYAMKPVLEFWKQLENSEDDRVRAKLEAWW